MVTDRWVKWTPLKVWLWERGETIRTVIYRWCDRRGRYPFWVKRLWPYAHFCSEMDELFVMDHLGDCFCDVVPEAMQEAARGPRFYVGQELIDYMADNLREQPKQEVDW